MNAERRPVGHPSARELHTSMRTEERTIASGNRAQTRPCSFTCTDPSCAESGGTGCHILPSFAKQQRQPDEQKAGTVFFFTQQHTRRSHGGNRRERGTGGKRAAPEC